MLDSIRQFVTSRLATRPAGNTPVSSTLPGVQVAACALLLELAHADGEFSEAERTHIEQALGRHFSLDDATTRELMALAAAERSQSVDHFQFTRLISAQYDLAQKMVLAEVMWGVILADGHLADHEAYLVRKLANLLELQPGFLAEARRAASPPAEG
jgi:uncharacterized tellurite resistance protein B-like protein